MDNWLAFLESLATEYELPARPRKLFLFQFDKRRKNMTVNQIREELWENSENFEESNYDDYRRRLYASFSQACPELMNAKKDKARILWKWLEERYLDWSKTNIPRSLDEIWQELWQLARYTPSHLGVMLPQIDQMAMDDDGEERFLTRVVSKSPVWMRVTVFQSGYLVLLDRDATGEIVCLSPSPYVPECQIEAGCHRLPQENASKQFFKPATLGDEVFLAILFPHPPDIEWLIAGSKCLRLEVEHLQQLLDCIKSASKPVELMRSQIKIVAA